MIDLLQLFLTHLQGYKRQAVWSPILIVVEVICELLRPGHGRDRGYGHPSRRRDLHFSAGCGDAGAGGRGHAVRCAGGQVFCLCQPGFGANLRQCLFDKVQEFSFADIDRFSSASLITRMTNDVNAMTMMLAMGLRMLVRAPVMLVAACVSASI